VIAIAARAGVPIVPVGVRGAFDAFPRDARIPRPHPVSVAYGKPLEVPLAAARSREDQSRWAGELMQRIGQLCVGAD
jgi:1-acyl-sn-glycerol-3-phosphate acyltransferase